MVFQTDKALFRTWDPDRGWELIWEKGDDKLLYRLENEGGATVRFSAEEVADGEIDVVLLTASEEVPNLETLISEALNAYGKPLTVRLSRA